MGGRMGDESRPLASDIHELPVKVAALMQHFTRPWFIAGGWAIDLYLGRVTRAHADIEVAILRKDQGALRDYLQDWQWQKIINGAFADWPSTEWLALPVFELYCRNETAVPAQLEILLNESHGDTWVFRRNANVTRALAQCWLTTATNIKYLAPEIVLLYKSKAPRAKDEQDFAAVVERLEPERRTWLRAAIATCAPGHHWLNRL
jgi:Aminoglycoside-2''-adenylyltransferase